MRNQLAKLLSWIDQQYISIGGWMIAFSGVVLLRVLFKSFSTRATLEFLPPSTLDIMHYWFFFFSVASGIMCILSCFTGNAVQAAKVVLFGLPIIWIAPLFDLAISGGTGCQMGYIGGGFVDLALEYFIFLWPFAVPGVTPGMQLEIASLLVGLGAYVWLCRRSFVKALGAMLSIYTLIFLLCAAPSIIHSFIQLFSGASDPPHHTMEFFRYAIVVSNIPGNHLPPRMNFTTPAYAAQAGFDNFMGHTLFLTGFLFSVLWFHRAWPQKVKTVISNCRPERLTFYLVFLGIGMLLAAMKAPPAVFSWVDGVSIAVLALAWCAAWMHAIHINDIFDASIDAISNSIRPLARGTLTVDEMDQSGFVWLAASLLGAASVGYLAFFMNVTFLVCYYIYSAPPLRLRRIPLLSSFLIAIAVLSTVLAGFFFLSTNKRLEAFPISLLAGILLIFTLGVNVRDLKDVKGDKAEGVGTLPVLFKKHGVKITAALFSLSFLLTPLVFRAPILWCVAIPAALVAYGIATRKPYQEKWVFVLYFCFVAVGAVLFAILPTAFNLF